MSVSPHWLGWDRPFLESLAEWLLDPARAGDGSSAALGSFDLGDTLVVLPGRRPGRRLQEILLRKADESGTGLVPPRFVTSADLALSLSGGESHAPSDLLRTLVMVEAIRRYALQDPEAMRQLVARPPAEQSFHGWLHIGKRFLDLRDHLASAGVGLSPGEWPEPAQALLTIEEEYWRWEQLALIAADTDGLLQEHGMTDPARLQLDALGAHAPAVDERVIVLAGVAILPPGARRMLEILSAEEGMRVEVLHRAPHTYEGSGGFDEMGVINPDWWREEHLDLSDEDHLVFADGVPDQTHSVAREIAALGSTVPAIDITVGVADSALVPLILQQLSGHAVASRYAAGRALSTTLPFRLLSTVSEYIEHRSSREFASLLRHPDLCVAARVHDASGRDFDAYYSEHLPAFVPGHSPEDWLADESSRRSMESRAHLAEVASRIDALLAPLLDVGVSSIVEVAEATRSVLRSTYGDMTIDRDDPMDRVLWRILKALGTILDEVSMLPGEIVERISGKHAADHLRSILHVVEEKRIPHPSNDEALDVTDWLELALDDAPHIILAGLNEEHVPRSTAGDAFLPDALRRALGLEHNDLRFARDAYALRAMIEERKQRGSVRLIVGRRDSSGTPIAPSPLLFLGSDDTRTVQRINALSRPRAEPPVVLHPLFHGVGAGKGIPRILPGEGLVPTLDSLSVTAFKVFLACPYRFWLDRLLYLEAVDSTQVELTPAQFGSFVHGVLEDFGRDSEASCSMDEATIIGALDQYLSCRYSTMYGDRVRPEVLVQVEHARRRLHAFAPHQARRAAEGWRILHTEYTIRSKDHTVPFPVDDSPFFLHGRIDRIDYNPECNMLAVWDYKTGSTVPDKDHATGRGGDRTWHNLQLPLYRHLVRLLPEAQGAGLVLGYILLPSDAEKTGFHEASWEEEHLLSADACAAGVVRKLRDRLLWPPSHKRPRYTEALSWICQDEVLNPQPIGGVA